MTIIARQAVDSLTLNKENSYFKVIICVIGIVQMEADPKLNR